MFVEATTPEKTEIRQGVMKRLARCLSYKHPKHESLELVRFHHLVHAENFHSQTNASWYKKVDNLNSENEDDSDSDDSDENEEFEDRKYMSDNEADQIEFEPEFLAKLKLKREGRVPVQTVMEVQESENQVPIENQVVETPELVNQNMESVEKENVPVEQPVKHVEPIVTEPPEKPNSMNSLYSKQPVKNVEPTVVESPEKPNRMNSLYSKYKNLKGPQAQETLEAHNAQEIQPVQPVQITQTTQPVQQIQTIEQTEPVQVQQIQPVVKSESSTTSKRKGSTTDKVSNSSESDSEERALSRITRKKSKKLSSSIFDDEASHSQSSSSTTITKASTSSLTPVNQNLRKLAPAPGTVAKQLVCDKKKVCDWFGLRETVKLEVRSIWNLKQIIEEKRAKRLAEKK
jgi:hypothetical protein